MRIIGLTGGIGSGKSVVAQIFAAMDIPVYDSDKEAKRITVDSPLIRQALSNRFGNKLYAGKILNNKLLASLIFNNKEDLNYVNSVIHPEVLKDFLLWKKQYDSRSLVCIESAILFESSLAKTVDVSINVSAPLGIRVARIQQRDKMDRASVFARIQNQLSDEERTSQSNYTIINDDRQAILPQIENILKDLYS